MRSPARRERRLVGRQRAKSAPGGGRARATTRRPAAAVGSLVALLWPPRRRRRRRRRRRAQHPACFRSHAPRLGERGGGERRRRRRARAQGVALALVQPRAERVGGGRRGGGGVRQDEVVALLDYLRKGGSQPARRGVEAGGRLAEGGPPVEEAVVRTARPRDRGTRSRTPRRGYMMLTAANTVGRRSSARQAIVLASSTTSRSLQFRAAYAPEHRAWLGRSAAPSRSSARAAARRRGVAPDGRRAGRG